MFRQLLLLALCLACCSRVAHAQGYYPYAAEEDEIRDALPESDTTLFYRAVQTTQNLYGSLTRFALPQVSIGRRGESFFAERAFVDGIALSYRNFALLRLMGAREEERAGAVAMTCGRTAVGGMRQFTFDDYVPMRPFRVALSLADRNYRARLRATACGELGRGWNGAVAVDARTGRDMRIEGVFTHAANVGFRLRRVLRSEGDVALNFLFPVSLRSSRATTSEEALRLTGDRFYNPAWGYQAGKVRSGRVRREMIPMAWLTLRHPLTKDTRLECSFGGEGGRRARSGLGWYDARTPLPDNYRYMPSYTEDRTSEEAWRAQDPRYTQIDWDELIRQNRLSQRGAIYAVEDRVERLLNLQALVHLTTELNPHLTLWYEGGWMRLSSHNFKQMRDLLGGDPITDIDQFLVDDDTYGNRLQNNLRNPNRKIDEGDRFGYDYTLTEQTLHLATGFAYRLARLRVELTASVARHTVQREGHYEKELFPGALSLGASRLLKFTPYALKLAMGYAFSPRTYLELRVSSQALAPRVEDLFVQPEYANRTADDPPLRHVHAVEVAFRHTGAKVDLEATAFATLSLDEMERMNYFDDTSGEFCDLTARGIGRLSVGAEVAAVVRLNYRWTWSVATSVGRYAYVRDPHVEVLADRDHRVVDHDAVSHLGGVEVDRMPRFTLASELAFRGRKGWGARISAGYAAGRYVGASFVRRTDRVARQVAATPEAQAELIRQEPLGDAFALNASVLKTFFFERSMLTLSLMLRNITDDHAFDNGYESSRLMRYRAGADLVVRPQVTRLSSASPRSLFFSVSYRF